jgi:single-stranded-DNA-specific exonuclease
MHTKLAGVTYAKNAQTILPTLNSGTELELIREPENQYDKNAVRVEYDGDRLGFLPAHVARELAHRIDEGENFTCHVAQITGGGEGMSYGCNVELKEVGSNDTSDAMPQDNPLGRILPSNDELDEI